MNKAAAFVLIVSSLVLAGPCLGAPRLDSQFAGKLAPGNL